jgi:hypothetical protein
MNKTNMKKLLLNHLNRNATIVLGISIGLASCQEVVIRHSESEMHTITKSSVETAHEIFVFAQEVVDVTSDVLSDEGISIEGTNTSPENCPPTLNSQYIKDLTHYDTIIYAGTITMDYGTGTQCADKSTKRQGSMQNIFTYIINQKNNISSSVRQTISFHDFKRNNIQLRGRIISTAVTGSADTLKISAAKIIYENGSSILWHGFLANQRINSAGVIFDPEITTGSEIADTRLITGTIQSTTTDGKFFTASIRNAISYNYDCSGSNSLIPVKGTVDVQVNQLSAIVDYGNGSCDRTYTVTINSNSVTYLF